MDAKSSKRQKRRENALCLLDAAIEAMNLVKEISGGTPAKAVFGSVSVLLTMIMVRFLLSPMPRSMFTCDQNSMANKSDYVELGLACADVCKALDRGMNGKKLNDLSQSVREAIEQLTRSVEPGIHIMRDSLTTRSIAGLWKKSRETSSRRVTGICSPDLCMQKMIRIRLLVGS